MPYADALAKPNHFFGALHSTGIYLYKTVFSNFLDTQPSIPHYLLLSFGHLSMRTNLHQAFRLGLLRYTPISSSSLPHLPDEINGSP